jgi:5'-deoxynucleotidase YfbR-like HD superfamily hydrolase
VRAILLLLNGCSSSQSLAEMSFRIAVISLFLHDRLFARF